MVIPSISFNKVVNTLDCTPDVAEVLSSYRFIAIESSSSKRRTHGAAALALEKIERKAASDPPSHWLNTSDDFTF